MTTPPVEDCRAHPRDRPRALAPKGTSWGLVGILILPQAMAMFALMSAMPWAPNGVDLFIDGLFPAMGLSLVLFLPLILALRTHAYWGVWWFFCIGCALVISYPIALAFGFAYPLGFVKPRLPGARIVGYFGSGALALLSPLVGLLIRALRLKYWQPWSRPNQWKRATNVRRAGRWASSERSRQACARAFATDHRRPAETAALAKTAPLTQSLRRRVVEARPRRRGGDDGCGCGNPARSGFGGRTGRT